MRYVFFNQISVKNDEKSTPFYKLNKILKALSCVLGYFSYIFFLLLFTKRHQGFLPPFVSSFLFISNNIQEELVLTFDFSPRC